MSENNKKGDSWLDIAERDLTLAEDIMNYRYLTDDWYISQAAYHIQQAVEKIIKYQMEQRGIEYKKTHLIGQLIEQIEESNQADKIIVPEYFDDNSEMISSWEAQTRYPGGLKTKLNKVNNAIKETKEYIEQVRTLYSREKTEVMVKEESKVDESIASRVKESPTTKTLNEKVDEKTGKLNSTVNCNGKQTVQER